ncbi:Brp/Blh family beta-carotene 15,15'-dioxygenase [Maribacter halichondriae]|uniref:Brp/Blh family beta-carotene 15,15'-dioxygenase n=1 Tax=Maribacter halichondriae TaxID=2980554 RepID=UPI0023593293|nr:Brp/Blh family beta-carotene 15,15'-dioxygenase [Maribacter sp. Hal144]
MKNTSAIITEMNNMIIVATFFFLWLAIFFEDAVENIFAYILILSFGILHGANDLKLLQKSESIRESGREYITWFIYYVLFVLISLSVFYFIPAIALVLFVIFSAYHFGEQHWAIKVQKPTFVIQTFFICYGFFILFLLFHAHENAVTDIIYNITGYTVWRKAYFFGCLISGSTAALLLGTAFINKTIKSSIVLEVFLLLVFFVVFNVASLLWAFAIYFILWHSLPSLAEQIVFLHGNLSGKSIKKYIVSSFPYWIISVIGISLLLYMFRDDFETSLAFFFSFLAAITFPHILVISRLKNNEKGLP